MNGQDLPMLVVHEGKQAGERWILERDVITIGRVADCDITIPERQVSRYHARLERRREGYVLLDLGSKNGTFVNGQEITAPRQLQDGDEIQIALCVKLAFVGADATVPLSNEQLGAPIRIDKGTRRVWVRGIELSPPLSLAQYRLIEALVDADGRVCSRDEIVAVVWPEAEEQGITEQAIDALVRRLRDRIAEIVPEQQFIVTVRGHGFRLDNI